MREHSPEGEANQPPDPVTGPGRTHIACHHDDKDTAPDISVHALLLGQLDQLFVVVRAKQIKFLIIILDGSGDLCLLFRLGIVGRLARLYFLLPVDERITGPGGTDQPPFALGFGIQQIIERYSDRFMSED